MDTECGPEYRTREVVLTCPGYGYSPRGTVKVANVPYYKTPPNTIFYWNSLCMITRTYYIYVFICVGSRAYYSMHVENRGQLRLSGSAQALSPAQPTHSYCIINS